MALILIMGLPASGKSTLRQRLQNSNRSIVESTSFDEFRMMQSRPIDNAREARKAFELHVENQISMEKKKKKTWNKVILIEDIFYMKSMRRPFQKISRRRQLKFGVAHLNISTSEAMRRNSERNENQKQKEETILKIYENLEMPDPRESIILEQDYCRRIGLEELLERLGIQIQNQMTSSSEEEIPEIFSKKMKPTPPSLPLQNFDVLTRRLVSEIIQNDRSLDGRKMSMARTMLISEDPPDLDLNYNELKFKLMNFYNKI